jgi:hypothetical protein
MSDASQLPVAVDIKPGEDIAAFLQRVADANYLDFPVLTGHRRTARVWENPDHHCWPGSRRSPGSPWNAYGLPR